ncbi:MAG TPA: quinolinate synthase NadA [Deltaproteobacteria bacterium]|nr:quinolinate synthase NadA [Deltaproteobacteria bacterium]HXK47713.1 quinolinate synthase NadA [Deltaproteobacteria bacterium]
MTDREARTIIARKKKDLGDRLVILGHHYQRDAVIEFADFVGDSLELARAASQEEKAEFIVFCGVYFMAETAAILAPEKQVFIPDRGAGCPLADMAPVDRVSRAWDAVTGVEPSVVPVTYVNSSAALKAFCGARDGAVCTSANAKRVLDWALGRGRKVLFMPDMNLGRNTARSMGIPDEEVVMWDHGLADGGLAREAIERARIILWKGWCPVHCPEFGVPDVERVRSRYPGIRVMVHPETDPETVKAAGEAGSTSQMLSAIEALPAGGRLAVGTEANMVLRAARKHAGRVEIVPLKEVYCDDMARITLPKLAGTLMKVDSGEGRVELDGDMAGDARRALEAMLRI